jgi:hypothetical protein
MMATKAATTTTIITTTIMHLCISLGEPRKNMGNPSKV